MSKRMPCSPLKRHNPADPELEVMNSIIRANRHLTRAVELMRQNPDIFPAHWVKFVENWRECIGAYGGSIHFRLETRRLYPDDE